MIKSLLTITEQKQAKEFCNKILNNDVTPQYIEKNTGTLTNIMYKIMPEDYTHSNLLMEQSILVDDILEMESISQEEKNNEIQEMLNRHMNNLIILAKDILIKIKSDENEANKSKYCSKLMNQ